MMSLCIAEQCAITRSLRIKSSNGRKACWYLNYKTALMNSLSTCSNLSSWRSITCVWAPESVFPAHSDLPFPPVNDYFIPATKKHCRLSVIAPWKLSAHLNKAYSVSASTGIVDVWDSLQIKVREISRSRTWDADGDLPVKPSSELQDVALKDWSR